MDIHLQMTKEEEEEEELGNKEVHVFKLNGGDWRHAYQMVSRLRRACEEWKHWYEVEVIIPGCSTCFNYMRSSSSSSATATVTWGALDLALSSRCLLIRVKKENVEKVAEKMKDTSVFIGLKDF